MFAYCGNCPVNRVDFTGNSWDDIFKAIGEIAFVAFATPKLLLAASAVTVGDIKTAVAAVAPVIITLEIVSPDKETHYARNTILNNTPDVLPQSPAAAIEQGWEEEKASYHQNNLCGGPNTKYIKGQNEVVFYGNGKINLTPEDVGTANFCNSKAHPIGHFILDMYPYYKWGNSKDDKTSLLRRLFGR